MTATRRKRRRLGRWTGLLGGRQAVYEVNEGLEIDERDGYEVTRKRVFWEDVLLVTYHRYIGVAYPLLTALAAVAFGLMALALGSESARRRTKSSSSRKNRRRHRHRNRRRNRRRRGLRTWCSSRRPSCCTLCAGTSTISGV